MTKGSMNKILTNVMRIGFAGWIVFEFLNLIDVLHFTLDFTWFGLMITGGFVWAAMEVISAKLKKATGKPLPWYVFAVGLAGISLDALGDVSHWYMKFEWYDQVGHANGGAMTALVFFFIFYRMLEADKIKLGPKLLGFMALCGGTLLGVMYELEEYIEDIFTGGNRLGSGIDTANDLMWNTIGGLIVVIIAVRIIKKVNNAK